VTISLRTSRLLLRPWRDADVAAYAELSADPVVMEFLRPATEPGAAEAWAARAREHWQQHGFGQWVVEIPGEASLIGVVGLNTISYEAHSRLPSRLPGGSRAPIGGAAMRLKPPAPR
jgi:RimJ/RimL family protein N-acetyltransferase